MILVQITGLQSAGFFMEVLSSSTKIQIIITTALQLPNNDFTGRFKKLRIPQQNNSVE